MDDYLDSADYQALRYEEDMGVLYDEYIEDLYAEWCNDMDKRDKQLETLIPRSVRREIERYKRWRLDRARYV